MNSAERFDLTLAGDQVWIYHRFDLPRDLITNQARNYSLMTYLTIIRQLAGPTWQPSTIYLQCHKLPGFDWCDHFPNVCIYFNQSVSAVVFPRSLLSLPIRSFLKSNGAQPLLEEKQFLEATAPAQDFPESLRQLVRSLLPSGDLSIELIAAASSVSARTLQRRLALEGLTYTQFIDQVRFDEARCLLNDSTNKMHEIASELGYSDAANFTRAFRRWTGMPPRSFQKTYSNV